MKEISLLSLPPAGRFCRGFFTRTDIHPPTPTYRNGRTPDGSARCAGGRLLAFWFSGNITAAVAGSGCVAGLVCCLSSILSAGCRGAVGGLPPNPGIAPDGRNTFVRCRTGRTDYALVNFLRSDFVRFLMLSRSIVCRSFSLAFLSPALIFLSE